MAFVRSVIFSSTFPVSIHQVSLSQSTNTGTHPFLITARAHEIIVNAGMIISLPSGKFNTETANSNAVEPLLTATPCFISQYSAHLASNSLIKRPPEDIHDVRIHSDTYFNSFPSNRGSFTGINAGSSCSRFKHDLFFQPEIRALLDLHKHGILYEFYAMPPVN